MDGRALNPTVAAVPVPEQTDLELAERVRYGDAGAFEEVYRRFGTMVFNLSLRLARDPEDAADLSQEIFLRLYRHLGKFRGRSSLRTWIYRVAVNHCRSRLRRRRPAARHLERPEELPDPGRGADARALAGDASRRLEEALAAIPAVFREAVVLRDLEGLAYGEIAAVLGVRIGTVRSRIARGREALRCALEERR